MAAMVDRETVFCVNARCGAVFEVRSDATGSSLFPLPGQTVHANQQVDCSAHIASPRSVCRVVGLGMVDRRAWKHRRLLKTRPLKSWRSSSRYTTRGSGQVDLSKL